MANLCDLRIEQANAAIRHFIQALPGGRITSEHRAEYELLVQAYFAAVKARDAEREPASLAA